VNVARASTPTSAIDVERLWVDSVGVTATGRDWSVGYPDEWDFYQAPDCPNCGSGCVWDDEAEHWTCRKGGCDNQGEEVEASYENGCAGPMMNYSYRLGAHDVEDEDVRHLAEALRDLPLCLVQFDATEEWALALTGGGMDLSWEIAEAFIRLGWLPPHFVAVLPAMSGRPRNDDDRVIIEACARTLSWAAQAAQRDLDVLSKQYPDVLGKKGEQSH
jgi:hypothetical protein